MRNTAHHRVPGKGHAGLPNRRMEASPFCAGMRPQVWKLGGTNGSLNDFAWPRSTPEALVGCACTIQTQACPGPPPWTVHFWLGIGSRPVLLLFPKPSGYYHLPHQVLTVICFAQCDEGLVRKLTCRCCPACWRRPSGPNR